MRVTLNIDAELLSKAAQLTGIEQKTMLVRMGLEALVARETSRRLIELGGSQPDARPIARRRR